MELDTKQALEALRNRCRTDLRFLCTEVLGMTRWDESCHDDLVKALDSPEDRKLILMPRGHQKTSFASTGWVIQQILKDPNEKVLIVSASWKLARDILRSISGYLENSLLPEIFGPFKTPSTYWTNEAINIAQKTTDFKNPTISTAGIDTGKTGSHCTLLIFDDIVAPENVTNKEQIQKTADAYRECLPLLDPGGRIVMIGTRYAQMDLYGQVIENDSKSLNGHYFTSVEDRKNWRDYAPR